MRRINSSHVAARVNNLSEMNAKMVLKPRTPGMNAHARPSNGNKKKKFLDLIKSVKDSDKIKIGKLNEKYEKAQTAKERNSLKE